MGTEDDTFDKLRRIDIDDAIDIYIESVKHLGLSTDSAILDEVANKELKKVGWTVDTLVEADQKRQK